MEVKNDSYSAANEELKVRLIYQKLLESWNNCNAADFADLFSDDGNVIGFDGSQMNGRKEINSQLSQIFSNHKTASYISIIREVRALNPDIFVLRAVVGMVPPGQFDINPAVNAIQTLIAQKQNDQFTIAAFQNTPAAFHERPDLREQLTNELRQALQHEKKDRIIL